MSYRNKIIEVLKRSKENRNYNRDVADSFAASICKEVDMEMSEVTLALAAMLNQYMKLTDDLKQEKFELERRLEVADNIIYDKVGKNGNVAQRLKVANGMPIAKKKLGLMELKLLYELGNSDADIMEQCGISRTTLWRRKKELEQEGRK